MKLPKFSLLTPVNVWDQERKSQLERAVKSIESQTFKDYEHIVINDGSSVPFEVPSAVKRIDVPHGERVIAYNRGLEQAKGEWICFLDHDDEYEPYYLERVNWAINAYPEYKMFNFGCRYIYKDGKEAKREPFEPKVLDAGHEVFGGGNVVNGTFVFHRSVYEDLGGYPPDVVKDIDCTDINYPAFPGQTKPLIRDLHMNTPYDFSAFYQLKFPELKKYFMVDFESEPNKILKELGNPWGQDFALFYQYTRKYHSKPIKEYLYVVHSK